MSCMIHGLLYWFCPLLSKALLRMTTSWLTTLCVLQGLSQNIPSQLLPGWINPFSATLHRITPWATLQELWLRCVLQHAFPSAACSPNHAKQISKRCNQGTQLISKETGLLQQVFLTSTFPKLYTKLVFPAFVHKHHSQKPIRNTDFQQVPIAIL